MTLSKPLMIATLTAAVALGAVSQKAEAADPLVGALIGGGIGAAIGHDVNRHNGGAVGGVIGAVIGSSIAASSNGYYAEPGYSQPYYGGARYYEPAPSYGYYAPPPAYYAPPVSIVYSYGPRYGYGYRYYGHGYRGHGYRDGRHW